MFYFDVIPMDCTGRLMKITESLLITPRVFFSMYLSCLMLLMSSFLMLKDDVLPVVWTGSGFKQELMPYSLYVRKDCGGGWEMGEQKVLFFESASASLRTNEFFIYIPYFSCASLCALSIFQYL